MWKHAMIANSILMIYAGKIVLIIITEYTQQGELVPKQSQEKISFTILMIIYITNVIHLVKHVLGEAMVQLINVKNVSVVIPLLIAKKINMQWQIIVMRIVINYIILNQIMNIFAKNLALVDID